jgi:hypothetical protein
VVGGFMLLISEQDYKEILLHNYQVSSKELIKKLTENSQLVNSDFKCEYDLKQIIKYGTLDSLKYEQNVSYPELLRNKEFLEYFTVFRTKDEIKQKVAN